MSGNPQSAISLCSTSLSLCVGGPPTPLLYSNEVTFEKKHHMCTVCYPDNNGTEASAVNGMSSCPMNWLAVNSHTDYLLIEERLTWGGGVGGIQEGTYTGIANGLVVFTSESKGLGGGGHWFRVIRAEGSPLSSC